jgi:hypothetical protein
MIMNMTIRVNIDPPDSRCFWHTWSQAERLAP